MSKRKPRIRKGSEDGGTGRFHHCQSHSSNFIRNKQKPIRILEGIKNEVFDLFPQGQTQLFANSKNFYYIYEIKFQKNGRYVQYAVNNLSKPRLSAPTELAVEAGKNALTMSKKGILDSNKKCFY